MLLYNWNKIYTAAEGSAVECFRIFEMLVRKKIPYNTYDKIYHYSSMNFTGESFLLHPEALLHNSYRYKRKDIGIYLALASLRPIAQYYVSGKITLDVLHSVGDLDSYNKQLLPISDGEIHFLYEEEEKYKNGTNI